MTICLPDTLPTGHNAYGHFAYWILYFLRKQKNLFIFNLIYIHIFIFFIFSFIFTPYPFVTLITMEILIDGNTLMSSVPHKIHVKILLVAFYKVVILFINCVQLLLDKLVLEYCGIVVHQVIFSIVSITIPRSSSWYTTKSSPLVTLNSSLHEPVWYQAYCINVKVWTFACFPYIM